MTTVVLKQKTKLKNFSINTEISSVTKKRKRKHYKKEEQGILKACLEFLQLKGCLVYRNNSGIVFVENGNGSKRAIRMGMPGAPDIIGCAPGGIFLAIECKTKTGKVSQQQKEFLQKVHSFGGFSIIVRDVEDLVEKFNERFK